MAGDKEIRDVLDECLERLLARGESIERCLESYPEHAAELEPLLRTAMSASEAAGLQPSADLKARARYQLRAELDRMGVRQRRPFFAWQARWAVAIVAVLVVVLVGGGAVVAADSSMPDSLLYPVKLATENVRVQLVSSDVRKAEVYAALAERRLAEIARMIEKGKARLVRQATERLRNHLEKMAGLPLAGVKARAVREVAPRLEAEKEAPDVAREEASEKVRQAPTLEKAVRESPEAAVTARPRAAQTGQPSPTLTEAATREQNARLRLLLGYYAVNHPAKLRAMLEKAPESAKPALRQTIAVSIATYKKALEKLDEAQR